jgi:hypothetical protein
LNEVMQIGVQPVVDALDGLIVAQGCIDGARRLGCCVIDLTCLANWGTHDGVFAVDVAGWLVIEDMVDGILVEKTVG